MYIIYKRTQVEKIIYIIKAIDSESKIERMIKVRKRKILNSEYFKNKKELVKTN